jgi:hypothetical protein
MARCQKTLCLSIYVQGCPVVDAWGCALLYPPWKTFAFAFFVFQLRAMLLQFFAPFIVIILGTN